MVEFFEALEIPSGADICVIEAPDDYLVEGLEPTDTPGSSFDVVKVYVKNPDTFAEQLAEGERIVKDGGQLWVAYPKQDSNTFTDEYMRSQAAPLGLQPTKNSELDEGWNAVKMERLPH